MQYVDWSHHSYSTVIPSHPPPPDPPTLESKVHGGLMHLWCYVRHVLFIWSPAAPLTYQHSRTSWECAAAPLWWAQFDKDVVISTEDFIFSIWKQILIVSLNINYFKSCVRYINVDYNLEFDSLLLWTRLTLWKSQKKKKNVVTLTR